MSDIYKGELQDYKGNTIYPHSEADVIFCTDGETTQSKLNKYENALGNVTGVTDSLEVDDSKILVSAKALHKVNSSLGGVSQFIVDDSTGKITGYKTKAGADTVFPFSGGNFKLVIVIRVVGQNYAGVQATKDGTITIQCIDGNITYTPAVGQSFGNSSYNIWQGDQTWTAQSASIVSVTYTPL